MRLAGEEMDKCVQKLHEHISLSALPIARNRDADAVDFFFAFQTCERGPINEPQHLRGNQSQAKSIPKHTSAFAHPACMHLPSDCSRRMHDPAVVCGATLDALCQRTNPATIAACCAALRNPGSVHPTSSFQLLRFKLVCFSPLSNTLLSYSFFHI